MSFQNNVRGRLLVVEGPDGVGKTTACDELAQQLRATGHDVVYSAFPGKSAGTLGELVYRLHHQQGKLGVLELSSLARQALHVSAHVDAIERVIGPALRRGKLVLLDRFWWSLWAYGLVSGCDERKLRAFVQAERITWGEFRPHLAILLLRSKPLQRADPLPYWKRLGATYLQLAEQERGKYPVTVIHDSSSPAETVKRVLQELDRQAADRRPGTSCEMIKSDGRRPSDEGARSTVAPSHIAPLKPTAVYDTYWRFAAERQAIFFRRMEGLPPPWTEDRILATYKFTNPYRASDRVSQYLIRNVIYRDDLASAPDSIFFRVMLFKLFNKIATWESLQSALGPIDWATYSFELYDQVLTRLTDKGTRIYSAAYIIPCSGRESERKHRGHLALLERMIANAVPHRLMECRSMQEAFELMKSFPGIGDFLAYQFVTDINYSQLTSFSEMEFVVPGPGALDGIRKCFLDIGSLNEPEIIKFMTERQEQEFARLGLHFNSLWTRPLQLIDCQNLFCEVDKYARVRHPEAQGISGRSRIKQRFSPKESLPEPWYPPKWEINSLVSEWRDTHPRPVSDSVLTLF
jgi:thymidylate kinase